MEYTLIFEKPDGATMSTPISDILWVFHNIKISFARIKKNKETLTLIYEDKYLYKPNETKLLIQMVKDYYKFIDDKLALIDLVNKNEIIVFNTGNSDWVDTNLLEALKRPCDKTTKLYVVKKKELIKISKKHTEKGIYKLIKS